MGKMPSFRTRPEPGLRRTLTLGRKEEEKVFYRALNRRSQKKGVHREVKKKTLRPKKGIISSTLTNMVDTERRFPARLEEHAVGRTGKKEDDHWEALLTIKKRRAQLFLEQRGQAVRISKGKKKTCPRASPEGKGPSAAIRQGGFSKVLIKRRYRRPEEKKDNDKSPREKRSVSPRGKKRMKINLKRFERPKKRMESSS